MNLSMTAKSNVPIIKNKGCEFTMEKGEDRAVVWTFFFSFKTRSPVAQAGLDLTM